MSLTGALIFGLMMLGLGFHLGKRASEKEFDKICQLIEEKTLRADETLAEEV